MTSFRDLSLEVPGILAPTFIRDKGSELMIYDVLFKVRSLLMWGRTSLFIDGLYPV